MPGQRETHLAMDADYFNNIIQPARRAIHDREAYRLPVSGNKREPLKSYIQEYGMRYVARVV